MNDGGKLFVSQGILQTEIEPRRSKIDDICRSLADLEDFDKARVQAILERWEAAQHQIDNRLVGLVKAEHKLEQFQAGLQNELDWLNRVEEKVEDRQWSRETTNAENVMEELTVSWTFLFYWGRSRNFFIGGSQDFSRKCEVEG